MIQSVTFQSDGLAIDATLALPNSSNLPFPAVIVFHGMTSSKTGYIPLITRLAEQGIAGLAVSMRGHGESEGDFQTATVAEAINDALAAYDFLVKQTGIDASNIGMVGSSVGAILTALATEQRAVKSLVFRAPAAYTSHMMQLTMAGTMVDQDKQFHEIDNLIATPAGTAISKFTGSFLVVASEHDAIIPLKVPEAYLAAAEHAARKQLLIIQGATHTLTEQSWKTTFEASAISWLSETLRA